MADKRIFSEEEIAYLKENYASTKNRILEQRLGIKNTLLLRIAKQLGLKKMPNFQSECTKVKVKYGDGRANNRPSPQAMANSQACIRRMRQDKEKHAEWRKNISESMKKLYRAERRRVLFGLEQKTNKKVFQAPKYKHELRYRLRKCGYIIDRGSSVAYYDENTNRHAGKEESAKRLGIKIKEYEQTLRRV